MKSRFQFAFVLALASLLGGIPFACTGQKIPSPPPRIVFIIGENEYHTWETLPEFARTELADLQCIYCQASPRPGDNSFTNHLAIRDADLLVVSVRRRTPSTEMVQLIREYVAKGKPVVGIRTATHAFDAKPTDLDHTNWPSFDRDVFGANYQNHYNNTGSNAAATIVRIIAAARKESVLNGLDTNDLRFSSSLYRSRELKPSTTPLLVGHVEGSTESEPVAWLNQAGGRRAFYTSLGSPEDFRNPAFRRLLKNGILWALEQHLPEVPPTTK